MSKTRPGLHRAVHSRLDHYLASLREYVKAGHCMTRASSAEKLAACREPCGHRTTRNGSDAQVVLSPSAFNPVQS